jgi:hypothetical protein
MSVQTVSGLVPFVPAYPAAQVQVRLPIVLPHVA